MHTWIRELILTFNPINRSRDNVSQTCLRRPRNTSMLSVTYCMCPSSFLIKMWTVKSNTSISNAFFGCRSQHYSWIYKAHRYKVFFLVLFLLEIREDHTETTYWIRYSAMLLISYKKQLWTFKFWLTDV